MSQTCSSASLMSALPHMLVDFCTLDMTSCFFPVELSSTFVYPLITHSVIFKTYSLPVIDVVIAIHIGGVFPDTVSTFNSHSIQSNQCKSDFDSLNKVPTTLVVLVQFQVVYLESPRAEDAPWKSGVAT